MKTSYSWKYILSTSIILTSMLIVLKTDAFWICISVLNLEGNTQSMTINVNFRPPFSVPSHILGSICWLRGNLLLMKDVWFINPFQSILSYISSSTNSKLKTIKLIWLPPWKNLFQPMEILLIRKVKVDFTQEWLIHNFYSPLLWCMHFSLRLYSCFKRLSLENMRKA